MKKPTITFFILMLLFAACATDKKTEIQKPTMQKFNPLGKKYNDVIQYFEINDLEYENGIGFE